MTSTTTSFTFPKREFLHSKLDEVIQLWARGFGQGSFYFSVNDGTPSLQCGLQLELEDGPEPGSHHPHQQHQQHAVGVRRRGPARQARGRERAAKHQAALAAAAVPAAKTAPIAAAPAAKAPKFPAVILPFSGKLLHVKPSLNKEVAVETVSVSTPPPSTPPLVTVPTKPSTETAFTDVDLAKKNLFASGNPEQPPAVKQSPGYNPTKPPPIKPPHKPPPSKPSLSYRTKEDDLLTRLFTI